MHLLKPETTTLSIDLNYLGFRLALELCTSTFRIWERIEISIQDESQEEQSHIKSTGVHCTELLHVERKFYSQQARHE